MSAYVRVEVPFNGMTWGELRKFVRIADALGFDDEEDVGYEVPWDLEYQVGLRIDAPLDHLVDVIKEGAVDGS